LASRSLYGAKRPKKGAVPKGATKGAPAKGKKK